MTENLFWIFFIRLANKKFWNGVEAPNIFLSYFGSAESLYENTSFLEKSMFFICFLYVRGVFNKFPDFFCTVI